LEVTLQNQLSAIPPVHEALDRFAAQHNLSRAFVSSLHVALEEHLANIIKHGYTGTSLGTIRVRFQTDSTCITIVISDNGKPFNPLDKPDVNVSLPLNRKPLGGLGLLMIRRSVDEAQYEYLNGDNRLTLTKRVARPASPGVER